MTEKRQTEGIILQTLQCMALELKNAQKVNTTAIILSFHQFFLFDCKRGREDDSGWSSLLSVVSFSFFFGLLFFCCFCSKTDRVIFSGWPSFTLLLRFFLLSFRSAFSLHSFSFIILFKQQQGKRGGGPAREGDSSSRLRLVHLSPICAFLFLFSFCHELLFCFSFFFF